MNLSLWHGKSTSAIVADEIVIEYKRKIHRYESESDYKTLIAELETYGITAANRWLDYLVARQSHRLAVKTAVHKK